MYRGERPAIIMVSSAGAERINRYNTLAQRMADIPIVQLNPQVMLHTVALISLFIA